MQTSDCIHKNILIFVTNIYDWFYLKHSIHIQDEYIYLWPNFAQHFVAEFSPKYANIERRKHTMYIYAEKIKRGQAECKKKRLNITKLQIDMRLNNDINIESNVSIYKKYLYDIDTLHSRINGMIGLPYSVHAAKWPEFYSVGITMFFPTLRLWKELNTECDVIGDRQAGNFGERSLDKWIAINEYSPCCDTSPYRNKDQDIWLPFSDYYNDKLFKYIVYYDNETHLKQIIMEHSKYTKKYKDDMKWKQITEWKEWSDVFGNTISDIIWKAYKASLEESTNCISLIINQTERIIQTNAHEMTRMYNDISSL